jgi:hypothetical protein
MLLSALKGQVSKRSWMILAGCDFFTFAFPQLGKWSAPVPRCELVKCESLSTPGGLYEPHLQLEEHNNSYGGRAVFSCAWGYRLMGPPGIECELNGNWSGPLPKCVRKYIVVTNLSSFMTRTFSGHRQPSSVRHPLFQLTAISYSRRRREWTAADTPSAAWYNSRAEEPISSKARPASSARRTDSGPIRRLFVSLHDPFSYFSCNSRNKMYRGPVDYVKPLSLLMLILIVVFFVANNRHKAFKANNYSILFFVYFLNERF